MFSTSLNELGQQDRGLTMNAKVENVYHDTIFSKYNSSPVISFVSTMKQFEHQALAQKVSNVCMKTKFGLIAAHHSSLALSLCIYNHVGNVNCTHLSSILITDMVRDSVQSVILLLLFHTTSKGCQWKVEPW